MLILATIMLLASVCLIVATLMPFIPRKEWWFRVFDFPRVQIASLGLVLLVLWPFVYQGNAYEQWTIVLLLLAVLWQLSKILPFTPLSKASVVTVSDSEANADSKHQIAIMVSNVLMTNSDTQRLHKLVEQIKPDVLLTLETDERWQRALAPLEADYPYVIRCPQDNLYGIHLYSKLKLIDPQIQFLIEDDIPSIHTEVQLYSGKTIMLHCLHPAPPSPTENEKSIERDAELITIAKRVSASDIPAIVTGDLNDVAWSKTTLLFRKISGLLDPRIGRGLFNSFHAQYKFIRWPLDHLFHSAHFKLVELRRLVDIGSDHFPIFCQLQYDAMATEENGRAIKANNEDRHVAKKTLREARVNPSND